MTEGKKREIRRLINSAGVKVVQLRRISIGELTLGNLSLGKWKYLSKQDIKLSLLSHHKQTGKGHS